MTKGPIKIKINQMINQQKSLERKHQPNGLKYSFYALLLMTGTFFGLIGVNQASVVRTKVLAPVADTSEGIVSGCFLPPIPFLGILLCAETQRSTPVVTLIVDTCGVGGSCDPKGRLQFTVSKDSDISNQLGKDIKAGKPAQIQLIRTSTLFGNSFDLPDPN